MNDSVYIALYGFIPVVLALFALLPPGRAAITAYILGWLFLPMAAIKFGEGIPPYSKLSATTATVFVAALLFDFNGVLSFRFRWFDIPMATWCVCPLASSVLNGLGVYDGVSAVFNQFVVWGLPYLTGRIYFTDVGSLRQLAKGIFLGGLLYVPFCVMEMRLSPNLHLWVYGFMQHEFQQTMRFGGYRPMVFMQHGLMVGMWMTAASLAGLWLWWCGHMKHLAGMRMVWPLGVLLITTVFCRSVGALGLLAAGVLTLWISKRKRTCWLYLALLVLPVAYIGARVGGQWQGRELLSALGKVLPEERLGSVGFRIEQENQLVGKAMSKWAFGWGRWGRARVYDEKGEDLSTTDSLWILAVGETGVLGLSAMLALFMVPPWRAYRVFGRALLEQEALVPLAICCVLIVLYAYDNLFNGMINPIYVVLVGAVASTVAGAAAHAGQEPVPGDARAALRRCSLGRAGSGRAVEA